MNKTPKIYAIRRPDGTIIQELPGIVSVMDAWDHAKLPGGDEALRAVWFGGSSSLDSFVKRAKRLGYRCVEVELTPKGRTERLMDAITWALGANGDFPVRGPNDAAFWWRSELRRRAGLDWDGEKYVDVELVEKKP